MLISFPVSRTCKTNGSGTAGHSLICCGGCACDGNAVNGTISGRPVGAAGAPDACDGGTVVVGSVDAAGAADGCGGAAAVTAVAAADGCIGGGVAAASASTCSADGCGGAAGCCGGGVTKGVSLGVELFSMRDDVAFFFAGMLCWLVIRIR